MQYVKYTKYINIAKGIAKLCPNKMCFETKSKDINKNPSRAGN